MIKKTDTVIGEITGATCDCCGKPIKVQFGQLDDHVSIRGHQNGKLLEAVIYIPCMEEKLTDIKIIRKDCTIGYC